MFAVDHNGMLTSTFTDTSEDENKWETSQNVFN